MHELDRPIWHALAGRQRRFAEGSVLALRYHPDISPFAACRDDGPASDRLDQPQPAELVDVARRPGLRDPQR